MDIPVNRIRPVVGENALSWSEDGDLAILGTPNVVVYNTRDYIQGENLEFSRSEIAEPVDFEYNKDISTNSSINHADFAPPAAIEAGWSPTGMTSTGGCFLTVLSNKHQFLLFQNIGSPKMPEWVYAADLSWNLPGFPAIRCSDWIRIEDGSIWGYSLLALGTEAGLFIYKVFQGNFEIVEQHPDIYDCCRVKFHEATLYIQTMSSIIVHSPDEPRQVFPLKKRVSAIHVDSSGILVAHPGQVIHFPSNKSQALGFSEGVVGFLGTCTNWAAISAKGNVFIHNGFKSDIGQYLQSKRKAGLVTVLGVSTYGDGSAFAVSYFSRPSDGLFFPSMKNKAIVLSFHSLSLPTFSNIRVAPRAYWLLTQISKSEVPRFTDIEVPEEVGAFEHLLVDTDLFKMRLETYFRVKDHTQSITSLIAKLVLNSQTAEPSIPLDSAILVSYTKYYDAKVTCPAPLEVVSEQLVETFDFEAQKHNNVIESSTKHIWKRCNMTLLPVFTLDTLSSSNDQFQVLSPDSKELCETSLGRELVKLPFCIFNGCRFYRRVRT